MKLIAEPLTAEAFKPFGQVLNLPTAPGRSDYTPFLQNKRDHVQTCFRTSLTEPVTLPLTTQVMEKHEYSSQAFMPVDAGRYLIMVTEANNDGTPDMAKLRAFIARPDQGINYNANTWHHPMTVLDKPSVFATVMYADGGPEDEEWADLEEAVEIS